MGMDSAFSERKCNIFILYIHCSNGHYFDLDAHLRFPGPKLQMGYPEDISPAPSSDGDIIGTPTATTTLSGSSRIFVAAPSCRADVP